MILEAPFALVCDIRNQVSDLVCKRSGDELVVRGVLYIDDRLALMTDK